MSLLPRFKVKPSKTEPGFLPVVKLEEGEFNYNQLLDSLDNGVLVLDQQQCLTYANQGWHRLTEWPLSKSLGRLFEQFLHPEDRPLWRQRLMRFSGQSAEVLWLRLLTRADEVCWCELRIQSLNGQASYPLSITLSDITPRVRNEQVRDASLRSLTGLVGRLPVMLYRSRNNIDWTMEYVSEGCEALTGYCAEAMVNQSQISYGELIHPEDAGSVWDNVQWALQKQQSFELRYRLRHASGQIKTVVEKGCGVYSNTGSVLGVEGVIFALK